MKICAILVDDEPLALQILESYIQKLDNIELVATFTNAIKAFTFLQQQKIDILFLDIQMPALNGIELLKTLRNPPVVIITTAFRKYAVESFELDVMDYLLKPISFERFLKSIQKFYKLQNKFSTNSSSKAETIPETETIFVKENRRMVKLELDEIHYIESLKDYVRFHTNEKNIVSKMSMSKLEAALPSDKFIRVHRSYIISINNIEAFSASSIDLENINIPIGNTYKMIVLKRLEFLLK